MSKKDKIAIIIPSYNGQKYWSDLMPRLVAEHYDDFDLEVVVVDNNSSDSSVSDLKNNYPSIVVLENAANTGYVGANNMGYQYASDRGFSYIFLLNQDTVISNGFLQPLYDFAKTNKFGSLQAKINLWPARDRINTLGNAIHFLGFGYGLGSDTPDTGNYHIKKIAYASGAGVFLSMAVLEKFDTLFDETMFMYLEDLDLGWSLSLIGYDSYLIPASQIYHKYEFDRGMKQFYWFERNRLWTMLKNYRIFSLILILPAWLVMELGQIFFAVSRGNFRQKMRAYLWLFSPRQLMKLATKRRRIQSLRLRSDREVVARFSGVIRFQPLSSPILAIANLFFYIYWRIVKIFII